MILGFKTKFPWGEPTNFPLKILSSVELNCFERGSVEKLTPKLHTVREGQRFKAGDILHMATGVRTKQYTQFNEGIEQLERVKSVQRFDLVFRSRDSVILFIDRNIMYLRNFHDCTRIEKGLDWLHEFALNDGFQDINQFFRWFNRPIRNGQVIHWTDKIYQPSNLVHDDNENKRGTIGSPSKSKEGRILQ